MNIVLFGDSITDMGRDRTTDCLPFSLGMGYPFFIAGELKSVDPNRYTVYNRGIGGNRIVDLYARIKADVWNLKPDVLSILIGVNDIWHELDSQNGVDIERWEKVYRMILEDTKKRLPDCKIVLCEPFVLKGSATQEKYDGFLRVKQYAKILKRIADEYNALFLPLQEKFDLAAEKFGAENYLYDGVHPSVLGAKLIADEWRKLFYEEIQ
jgi:lysophospholipase L1-like esterase